MFRKEQSMMGSQALTALFVATDDALRVLYLALEGVDASRVLTAADELAALRRELATKGLVEDE